MHRDSYHPALLRARAGTALRIESVPTPSLTEGGLLVAPSFVGVCGTDLQILNGSRPDTAEILGHEAAGLVVSAGAGARLRRGEYVVFNPSAQLTRGQILGHNVPGLFQQYFAIDAQAVDDGLVQTAEDGLPPICGALVEPVGGVIYAHELIAHVVPDLQSTVIFGAGPIGLITAIYLREQGARVLLVHPNQARLDLAASLGLLDPTSAMVLCDNSSEQIIAWNGGQRLDAAVICTSMSGASVALRRAVEVVRAGGCIEMVTNYPASSPTPEGITASALRAVRAANLCGVPSNGEYVFAAVSDRRIAFTSHRGTSRKHLTRAMQVLKSNSHRYTALITHVLSLQEAAQAVETLACSREASIKGTNCIKAVIDLTPLMTLPP